MSETEGYRPHQEGAHSVVVYDRNARTMVPVEGEEKPPVLGLERPTGQPEEDMGPVETQRVLDELNRVALDEQMGERPGEVLVKARDRFNLRADEQGLLQAA